MQAKTFFKRFKWGRLLPVLFTFVAGILACALPSIPAYGLSYDARVAVEASIGALFALSGIASTVSFLLEYTGNVIELVACVAQFSVAIWLFVSAPVGLYMFSVTFAVVLILRAISEGYEALLARKGGGRGWIFRLVVAILFLAAGVIAIVDPFAQYAQLCTFIGAMLLVEVVFALPYILIPGGFFYAEGEPPRARRAAKSDPKNR